jgi:hypothetical protein
MIKTDLFPSTQAESPHCTWEEHEKLRLERLREQRHRVPSIVIIDGEHE